MRRLGLPQERGEVGVSLSQPLNHLPRLLLVGLGRLVRTPGDKNEGVRRDRGRLPSSSACHEEVTTIKVHLHHPDREDTGGIHPQVLVVVVLTRINHRIIVLTRTGVNPQTRIRRSVVCERSYVP